MYSIKEDRKRKLLFSVRVALPIISLFALLFFVVIFEKRSFYYDIFILFLGVIAAVYFIFLMLFSQLREQILDDISQTFNRRYIAKLIEKKDGIVALFSIDNIKEINERYGIENGDKILKEFARLIDRYFAPCGEVPIGRVKAGDFLVLLPDRCSKQIEAFVKKYDNTFLNNIQLRLFGSYLQKDGFSFRQLVDQLYEDIYYCQRNCIGKEKKSKKQEISRLEYAIQKSLQKEQLEFLFQPALYLSTKSYDVVEVIVKMRDEEGDIIHPSQFFPVINRLGLENSFDLVSTKKLLQSVQAIQSKTVRFAFNISPFSMKNRFFFERFISLFSDVDKKRFIIKIYEDGFSKDSAFMIKVLQRYQKEGFLIAFDRFGTANATIDYISKFNVNFVFFDKIYTKNLFDSRFKAVLLHWIQTLHRLDCKSVLKYLDKEELLQEAKSLEVDYLSGYVVCEPMQIEKLKNFLGA